MTEVKEGLYMDMSPDKDQRGCVYKKQMAAPKTMFNFDWKK